MAVSYINVGSYLNGAAFYKWVGQLERHGHVPAHPNTPHHNAPRTPKTRLGAGGGLMLDGHSRFHLRYDA